MKVPTKGWYWIITERNKVLTVRYFSGRQWKTSPSQLGGVSAPREVIERIKEPWRMRIEKEKTDGTEPTTARA
jgi:hypothetical protein